MCHRLLAAALVLAALSACTELEPFVRGACGNGIVEPEFGEDCDGPTDPLCGAPTDAAQACRRLCDLSAEAPCTDGAACGNDGVCHLASGVFTAASERTWTATDTLVLDGNGDGAPDVVGVSSQRVDLALGTGDGSFAATTAFPGQYVTGAPAIGDPTGDGLPDVLIPTPIGVMTLAGDRIDGLTPVTQNTIPVEQAGPIVFGYIVVGDEAGLVNAVQGDTGGALFIERGSLLPQVVPFPGGRNVTDLLDHELPVLDVGGDERVIVVTFTDGVWLVGASAETIGGETVMRLRPFGLVNLGLAPQVRRAFTAELTGDDHVELVVVTGAGRLQVVTGTAPTGTGFSGFGTGVAATIWTPVSLEETRVDPLLLRDAELTVADFDEGPGEAFELARLSVMAGRAGTHFLACPIDGNPGCVVGPIAAASRVWTHAQLLDLNGDDRVDFVGYAEGEPNVDVRLVSPGPFGQFLYNDAVIATTGPVRWLEFGELDGDGVTDTVIVQGRDGVDGGLATDHEIHVAFGNRAAAPSAPVLAAKLGEVVAIIQFSVPFAFRFDALDDLLVVSDRGLGDAPASRGAAVLFGSTSRRLVAPLLLSDEDLLTPVALAPMFLDDRAGEDLVVVARNGDDYAVLPYSPDGYTMQLLARHDLTATQVGRADHALWTTVARTGPTRIGAAADELGRVVAVEFACVPTCQGTEPTVRVLDGGAALPAASALRGGDVDGDGDGDLIGVFPTRAGTRVVLWTQADGMQPAPAHVFTFPGAIHDAVAADLDLDGRPEIVFAGDDGLAVAHDDGGWSEPAPLYPRGEGPAFVRVEVADFTGDGLVDLAVAAGIDRTHPVALRVLAQIEQRAAFAEGL